MRTNIHIYSSNIKHVTRMFKVTKTIAEAGIANEIILIGIGDGTLHEYDEIDSIRKIWRVPKTSLYTFGLPKNKFRSILCTIEHRFCSGAIQGM